MMDAFPYLVVLVEDLFADEEQRDALLQRICRFHDVARVIALRSNLLLVDKTSLTFLYWRCLSVNEGKPKLFFIDYFALEGLSIERNEIDILNIRFPKFHRSMGIYRDFKCATGVHAEFRIRKGEVHVGFLFGSLL